MNYKILFRSSTAVGVDRVKYRWGSFNLQVQLWKQGEGKHHLCIPLLPSFPPENMIMAYLMSSFLDIVRVYPKKSLYNTFFFKMGLLTNVWSSPILRYSKSIQIKSCLNYSMNETIETLCQIVRYKKVLEIFFL